MNALRPELIYRAFRGTPSHVAKAPLGHRLSSGLFFNKKLPVSIYLGEFTTLDEICRMHPAHGVASLPISLLQKFGIVPGNDPRDQPGVDLPGHRVFLQPDRGVAEELSLSGKIEVALRGYAVVGADQSQGVANPYARDPTCSQ